MRATRLLARRSTVACLRTGVFVVLITTGLLLTTSSSRAASNTITQPDIGGQFTSLKLDSAGFPVISHYDPMTHDLKVVHCGDASCSVGNTVTAPDSMAVLVAGIAHTSLALVGNTPVVTHYDSGPRDLRLVRCANPACSNPGNVIRTLDSSMTDNVGIYASVAIDGSGNPVVAYYYEPLDILKVLVCDDGTCSSYSDQMVDATAITGLYPSLVLDASGFPVISYYDQSTGDLNVAHCGDASCSTSVIMAVDGALGDFGKYTSLALDSSGLPVVSYYNESNGDLKVVHCGDANCSAGNTIATPDAGGASDVGRYTSLALDAAGNPVVSYYSVTDSALKVLHCGNSTCTSANTITTPDGAGMVGEYTSIALDGSGNPVVSYYDATDGKLNVLHCVDANCSPKPPTPTPTSSSTPMPVGGLTELANVQERSGGGHAASWLMMVSALAIAAVGLSVSWRRRGSGS